MTDFIPDAFALRTTDADGRSYAHFEWPREVGAIVTAPDWSPTPECGHGLHGLPDGLGDYGLLGDEHDRIWWIISFVRSESVDLDGKVKFPRCRVEYFGQMAGAMKLISQHCIKRMLELAKDNIATGYRGHAAATGDSGHAAATGDSGHAAATGDGGHAAATGDSGHAAATGDSGHAAATGDSGHAAATGDSGHAQVSGKHSIAASLGIAATARASSGGAICLAAYDDDFNLVAVRAAMVGQDGVEPDVTYRLTAEGQFEPVERVA